jgi:predicted AAA+ superfamily ATPase
MIESSESLDYPRAKDRLAARLAESAPSRLQLLSGPRQVGKTTILLDLAAGFPEQSTYAACDAPEAAIGGWWEETWRRAERQARDRGTAVLLLDEVQHLSRWAPRLKAEWDRVLRDKIPLHVVATGSSALHLTRGSKETLAGRFERTTLGHWSALALASVFGIAPGAAAREIVTRGAYPGAYALRNDPARWTAYVRDAIVEPAIGRDLLALEQVRKPALLRQLFAVAASSPGQVVTLQKLRGALQDAGALETLAHYLELLGEAFLIAALPKHAQTPARRRAAPPKLVVLSNAFLAATDPRGLPDPESDPARWGAWVENACLAHAWNSGQRVSYWRGEPHEVDAVIEGSWGALAVEVKTGPFGGRDLAGLFEFCRRFPSFRPVVVGDAPHLGPAERAGAQAVTWERWLTAAGPAEVLPDATGTP